jgi:hypothetical protein
LSLILGDDSKPSPSKGSFPAVFVFGIGGILAIGAVVVGMAL